MVHMDCFCQNYFATAILQVYVRVALWSRELLYMATLRPYPVLYQTCSVATEAALQHIANFALLLRILLCKPGPYSAELLTK